MGCSTCSTTTGETSPGCQNNGSCGTSGCNKLNVYNWLSDMVMPPGQKPYNIVEIRFKGSRKEFFKNQEYLELKTGDVVAVEGNPGHDIGTVSLAGELVRFQLKRRGLTETSEEIKALYRIARPADIEKWTAVKELEVETMYKARSIALLLKLRMKLSDVEYQGDGKKATFYYTADERVDFRELIKKLAEEFRVRIEMRQIGMRQEASRLGGIGSCGRELCCSTWLTDFKIVSTSAARYQNLSLNPIKLAGQCGKLKCCLNYELDSYMDALSDIPDSNSRLETMKGIAVHRKTDIFKRMIWFAYLEESPGGGNSDNWIALSVDRVKEIIALNKQQEKPADLNDYAESIPREKPMDYADVVGQDSLTRMMDKKKKKKKKSNNKENKGPVTAMAPRQEPRQGGGDNRNESRNQNRPRPESSNQSKPSGSPAPARQSNTERNRPPAGNVPSQRDPVQQPPRPQRTPVKPADAPSQSASPSPAPPQSPSPGQGGGGSGRVRQIPPRTTPPKT
ncbi:MAG: hypothetical protein M3Q95_04280 [Bacteroidota bacterium]|nr:hypothetical protein [Bacteroidota bacterium]